ncbi:MAG: PhzF family phenazine biosynthesis isomerase [Candidatus Heimdallarchaeota archaeon]|nr:PhzF family phenazine biosynthesis isomerase [Candidatus Heimdallarchaeota archaeon]
MFPIYQIDAFTDEPFKGNPAAICLLSKDYPDRVLQNIAAEMNLSETAFLYISDKQNICKQKRFRLRWFTPQVEVNLCGHATLATSHLLFHIHKIDSDYVTYETLSGELSATKTENGVLLDFPMNKPELIEPPLELLEALGLKTVIATAYSSDVEDILVEIEDMSAVKSLKPKFNNLKQISTDIPIRGVIVTAKGEDKYDFVSRFFGPWVGIDEDPVTGSAHTILAPYWAEKLNKSVMKAYQMSNRGGEVHVKLPSNDRVELVGNSFLVLKGEFYV